MSVSLNQLTCNLIEEKILPNLWELGLEKHVLNSGTTVIDFGINACGGYEAARLFTLVTLGGLGEVKYANLKIDDIEVPSVAVRLSRPLESALSSQFSAWKIKRAGEYQLPGFASGPARAIAYRDPIAKMWTYRDNYHKTALALQTAELPDEEVAKEVCEACGVEPQNVYLLAAKTGSLVGCVQIAARMAEVSLWGLGNFGFPLEKVKSFSGSAIIPPVVSDELIAMDRVNSSTLYGSIARYIVDCEDEEIEKVLPHMYFSGTRHYKRSFADLYDEAGRDIFKMDIDVHKVAVIEITNQRTGKTHRAGEMNYEMLAKSFGWCGNK
ncbi:MAG: methenyltetrahydromethanopterin cyclohydrolase [Lachnospiraceae bacterium]|jgi:methenyltetrahydromethanopterin cyclohydrolase|nr:methenyltetrahydromethanopterin cyclohydrolase [Lachnospiraceae bacterium]